MVVKSCWVDVNKKMEVLENFCHNCHKKATMHNDVCIYCNTDMHAYLLWKWDAMEKFNEQIRKYYEEIPFEAREWLAYADRMGL